MSDQVVRSSWREWIGRSATTSAVLDRAQADKMAVMLGREPGFVGGDHLETGWHWLYLTTSSRPRSRTGTRRSA